MITKEELLELADYAEQLTGEWKATLDIPGDVKLSLKVATRGKAEAAMDNLCGILARQLNAQRAGAKQAQALIHEILMSDRVVGKHPRRAGNPADAALGKRSVKPRGRADASKNDH